MLLRLLLIFVISLRAAPASQPRCDAVVVFQSGAEAYDAALTGIHESLANSSYKTVYIDLAENVWRKRLDAATESARLLIVVGIGVWDQVGNVSIPVLPSLVLREDLKSRHEAGAVFAEVPLTAIAVNLRAMFPGRSRLALLHRSSRPAPSPAQVVRLKQMGFEFLVVECSGPEKLLAAFASVKGQADLVITEPDPELYNSATVKPLVLASLEARLPLVGFSVAFVRAGALTGVFPDFHELGLQTGELMERILDGRNGADKKKEEETRKVSTAVNERIARLMGIEPAGRSHTLLLR